MKKIKHKKYIATLFGGNLSGLMSATYMADHGAKILVIEKNNYLGGRAHNFIIKKNGKKYQYEYDFKGIRVADETISENVFNDLKIKENINLLEQKIPFSIIINNKEFLFYNNITKTINNLIHKFPLERENLLKFTQILKLCSRNHFYFKKIIKKYKDIHNFIDKLFNDKEIKKIIESFAYFSGLSIYRLEFGYFIQHLIDYFISKIYYPFNGSSELIKFMVDKINYEGGDIWLNTKINKIIEKNKKLNNFNIIYDDKKYNLHSKKILIGLSVKHLVNDIIISNQPFFTKYKKLINVDEKLSKITIFFTIKKEYSKKPYQILFNEFGIDSIKSFNESLSGKGAANSILNIINYSSMKLNKNKTINCEFYDSASKWKKIHNDKKRYNIEINEIYKIIKKRLSNYFGSNFNLNILHWNIKTPIEKISLFNDYFTNTGIINDKKNSFLKKTSLMPWNNVFLVNKWGIYGNQNYNLLCVAFSNYHLFDFKFTNKKSTIIDLLTIENILFFLQQKYKPVKKYLNISIGINIDHEISFVLLLTENKIIIKKSTFDEAFNSKYFIISNLNVYKDIIQGRKSMTFQVILNKFRVKGGVWPLQRLLKKCNLYYLNITKENERKFELHNNESLKKTKNLSSSGNMRTNIYN